VTVEEAARKRTKKVHSAANPGLYEIDIGTGAGGEAVDG
jgi:hypothetical protein